MCYFSIATDEFESGDAWALGPASSRLRRRLRRRGLFRDRRRDPARELEGSRVECGALALRPGTRDGASGFPRPAHGANVHLFLHVKMRENWLDDPERYRAIGLEFPKG